MSLPYRVQWALDSIALLKRAGQNYKEIPILEEVSKEIDCTYTREIVCPHCGYTFSDSYEFFPTSDDETVIECQNEDCEKEFYCSPYTTTTYSSSIPKAKAGVK